MTCVSSLLMELVKMHVIIGYVFISRICFFLCCFHPPPFPSHAHELVALCKTTQTWHFLRQTTLDELWKKAPCVHLELLKGHCKYGVLIIGLFLCKTLSNMPGARTSSWRTALHVCRDLMASLFAFSLKKRSFILLAVSYEDFHGLKNKLFVGQMYFSPACLNIAY